MSIPYRPFRLAPDSSVTLYCPDCEEPLWLSAEEAPTLGDVTRIVSAHECEEDES